MTRGVKRIINVGACDVDEKIDAAEGFDGCIDASFDLAVVAQIGAMKDGAVAGRARRRLTTLLLDIGDQNGDFEIGKLLSNARADQRGAAGNNRYLVG